MLARVLARVASASHSSVMRAEMASMSHSGHGWVGGWSGGPNHQPSLTCSMNSRSTSATSSAPPSSCNATLARLISSQMAHKSWRQELAARAGGKSGRRSVRVLTGCPSGGLSSVLFTRSSRRLIPHFSPQPSSSPRSSVTPAHQIPVDYVALAAFGALAAGWRRIDRRGRACRWVARARQGTRYSAAGCCCIDSPTPVGSTAAHAENANANWCRISCRPGLMGMSRAPLL